MQKTDRVLKDHIVPLHANIETRTTINPSKQTLVFVIFKNPVRTSKRTLHFTITRITWLILFKGIIATHMINIRNTRIQQNAEILFIKAYGACIDHLTLKR
jgi:hypothetical protein